MATLSRLELSARDETLEHREGLVGGRLGDLVPSAANRDKCEVMPAWRLVHGGVSTDLLRHLALKVKRVLPRMPWRHLRVAQRGRPRLVVGVRHTCVPVAIVDDHTDVLDQEWVRVAGQVWSRALVRPPRGRATSLPRPTWDLGGSDMDGRIHSLSAHVLRPKDRVDAGIRAGRPHYFITIRTERCLVHIGAAPGELRRRARDARAVDVVEVHVAHLVVHLAHQRGALCGR
mmetsp:Transcript_15530/g.40240  ORF Transcript_15530/g.40240 Transcript_15530/m.40240 type:complete len:231 (+) Transcript_15530:128-820(+)